MKTLVIYDSDDVLTSVKELKNTLEGASFREFHGYEHFTFNDMGTREFPELLQEAIKEQKTS